MNNKDLLDKYPIPMVNEEWMREAIALSRKLNVKLIPRSKSEIKSDKKFYTRVFPHTKMKIDKTKYIPLRVSEVVKQQCKELSSRLDEMKPFNFQFTLRTLFHGNETFPLTSRKNEFQRQRICWYVEDKQNLRKRSRRLIACLGNNLEGHTEKVFRKVINDLAFKKPLLTPENQKKVWLKALRNKGLCRFLDSIGY